MKISSNYITYGARPLINGRAAPKNIIQVQSNDSFCSVQKPVAFGNSLAFLHPDVVSQSVERAASSIIEGCHSFGIREYSQLTQLQKEYLRRISPIRKSTVRDVLNLSDSLEYNLKEKFPTGFTLVSIGRSPALLAKMLEFKGFDAKICPISGLQVFRDISQEVSPTDLIKYGEYLREIGISKEAVEQATKPFVFTDYTSKGSSLFNFERLLARKEIDIHRGDNVRFLSLNNELLESSVDSLISKYFKYFDIKEYSPIGFLPFEEMERVKEVAQEPQTRETKFMLFHILDSLSEAKSQ